MLKFKLKVLLAMNNMTQKELAQLTGIRPPTISAICNASIKQFPIDALERICDVLDCQPSDIVEYKRTEGNLRTKIVKEKYASDIHTDFEFVMTKDYDSVKDLKSK